MKFMALLNKDGGTLRTTDVEAVAEELETSFRLAKHEIECAIISGDSLIEKLEHHASRDDLDGIIAAGGDGTISAAAGYCFRNGMVLGVLPAGTMNFFARTLSIPLDMSEAIQALATAAVTKADIATANDRAFIHQYSVGMQPDMVREREKAEYNSRLGKILASTKAAIRTLFRPPSIALAIALDDKPRQNRRVSLIAVSVNPHGKGHLPYPDTFDAGKLGIYQVRPLPPAESVQLATDLTLGSWEENPNFVVSTAKTVTLEFPRRKRDAQASIDGELISLEEKILIKQHDKGLRVLRPAGTFQTPYQE